MKTTELVGKTVKNVEYSNLEIVIDFDDGTELRFNSTQYPMGVVTVRREEVHHVWKSEPLTSA